MIITTVEKEQRSSRQYRIHLDNGDSFAVHEDTMIRHRLLKGTQLTSEQIERILRDEEWQKVYRAALRYVGRRPRTRQEIREKLAEQGCDAALAESVLQTLEKQRYIDDRQLARMWVEQRIVSQKKGRNFVQYELLQKGVAKEQIVEALAQVEEGAEAQGAYYLLCKKSPHTAGERVDRKRKLMQFLLRRGFTQSAIRQAFRRWNEEHPENPL